MILDRKKFWRHFRQKIWNLIVILHAFSLVFASICTYTFCKFPASYMQFTSIYNHFISISQALSSIYQYFACISLVFARILQSFSCIYKQFACILLAFTSISYASYQHLQGYCKQFALCFKHFPCNLQAFCIHLTNIYKHFTTFVSIL